MYKHLLVPIDGSEITERAIDSSITLARQLGAAIHGFVVEPTPPLPAVGRHPSVIATEAELHDARTEAHARGLLNKFKAMADAAGVAFKGSFERSERVGDAIVEQARENGCDMIVMATHGRGPFGELLFGSYTKSVLARSKLPLLVLH
jgi:nucleotide-binding universal stress UspA family protein